MAAKQGYTLVFVGWQFDIAPGKGLVGFSAADRHGERRADQGLGADAVHLGQGRCLRAQYGAGYNTRAPICRSNVAEPELPADGARGHVCAAAPHSARRVAVRPRRRRTGRCRSDVGPSEIGLQARAHRTSSRIETQNPPVAGLGMAAIRDAASAFKYGANQVATGKLAYMYGASQTGRLIRQMIHEGFTIDESGRKAFDAAFIQTGAVGFGSFNERFAQPNELGPFTQTKFPFLYKTTTDPITGRGGRTRQAAFRPASNRRSFSSTHRLSTGIAAAWPRCGTRRWTAGRISRTRRTFACISSAGTKHGQGRSRPQTTAGSSPRTRTTTGGRSAG